MLFLFGRVRVKICLNTFNIEEKELFRADISITLFDSMQEFNDTLFTFLLNSYLHVRHFL